MYLHIGITPGNAGAIHYELRTLHAQIIESLGALPLILPYLEKDELIEQVASSIDGLYVTGGDDIDPSFFKEEPMPGLRTISRKRDNFEIKLIQKMLGQQKPIFGICRGAQILNVATGGDMFQDIYSQTKIPLLQHEQAAAHSHLSHFVDLKEKTILYEVMQKKRMKVNSFHHQANRQVQHPMIVTARSSDGMIEAIESVAHPFVLGVQWHPEFLYEADIGTKRLYESFIKKCAERKG